MIKTFNLIAAVDFNGYIGYQGKIPWHISEELKYFKKVTGDNPVIMGRNTWDSLPKKPLPNRENLIISRTKENCYKCLDAALDYCYFKQKNPFVIGGSKVYQDAIVHPNLKNIYLSVVHGCFKGDVSFPEIPDYFEIIKKEYYNQFSAFVLINKNI